MVIIDDCLYYYRYNELSMTNYKKAYPWDWIPKMIKELEKEIPLDEEVFKDQFFRMVTREFFTTAKTQFYRNEPYRVIKRDILNHIRLPVYAKAVENCSFDKAARRRITEIILKTHWILAIYLVNKLEH